MTLAALKAEIERHIQYSTLDYQAKFSEPPGISWVLKFFPPQFLGEFLRRKQAVISTSAGFTWGDGAYVVPLNDVLSAMIYGRVGIMGYINDGDVNRVYDARTVRGIELYQEWIQLRPRLFDLLTTTVHAQQANRALRNAFRKTLNLDLVVFRPDEFNRAYVQPQHDSWFVVSDFSTQRRPVTSGVRYTNKVRDCELVAIGGEEFSIVNNGFRRQDVLGPHVDPRTVRVAATANTSAMIAHLRAAYAANRALAAGNKPTFAFFAP